METPLYVEIIDGFKIPSNFEEAKNYKVEGENKTQKNN
jgi:hypothetical protein